MGNLIRVDQNFALNAINWVNIFNEDTKLCFDIMFYMSNKAQQELFKYGYIDIDDFCKKMFYQKSNLQALYRNVKKEVPTQEKLLGKYTAELNRSEKYITVFENALFKLGRLNLPYLTYYVDSATGERIKNTKFIQILKEINIHYTKSKEKIYYTYITSEEFDYNLSRLFMVVDFSILQKLRRKNLTMLYMYLRLHESVGKTEWLEKNFSQLCHMAGISLDLTTLEEENKRKVKDAKYILQKRKLDELKKFLNFDYEEVNVGGKWKYGFNFSFNSNIKNVQGKEQKCIEDKSLLTEAQFQHIIIKLIKLYRSKHQNDAQNLKFEEWFLNPMLDFEAKQQVFFTALSELFNKPLGEIYKTQFNYFTKFFASLEEAELTTIKSKIMYN